MPYLDMHPEPECVSVPEKNIANGLRGSHFADRAATVYVARGGTCREGTYPPSPWQAAPQASRTALCTAPPRYRLYCPTPPEPSALCQQARRGVIRRAP